MGSLVLGAGLVGSAVIERLVANGEQVTVASRSGTSVAGARSAAVDAADEASLSALASGMSTIYLCTNPPYESWGTLWPPIFAAAIGAARASGAALVAMGNLYSYGRARMPMTEHSPETTTESKGLVRKAGWAAMREAHERGEIRAVEVRASDYFGPGATATAHLGLRFFGPLLAGRRAGVIGDPHAAHSWAYLPDIADTLVAAARYRGEWGRVWHVPSASDLSRAEIAAQVTRRYGTKGGVYGYPDLMLRAAGLVSPMMREVHASSYQFTAPFIASSAETERELGVAASDWETAMVTTAESYRQ